MSAKQILLNRLAEDDLKKVFEGFFFLADKYKDEQLRDNATFQSGRLKALEKQRINGTISQEEDYLQTAKIRQAILQIVQALPEDWTLDGMDRPLDSHSFLSKINWKKYVAYFAAAIVILAGIAELSGYSLGAIFQKNDTTEIPSEIKPPAPKASTKGDNSPAVITDEGDVNINYGEPKPKEDSASTPKIPQK